MLVDEVAAALPGGDDISLTFSWTPTKPGPYRLYALSDHDNAVDEYDEDNNLSWQDAYIGFPSPLVWIAGVIPMTTYAAQTGYGVVDAGADDILGYCGTDLTKPFDWMEWAVLCTGLITCFPSIITTWT